MDEAKIAEMLLTALKGEYGDADYYGRLADKITDSMDKEIVRSIRNDELKHQKMFTEMYKAITGKEPEVTYEKHVLDDTLAENFASSIFSELETMEFYRQLYFAFMDLEYRDMMFEILTDEQAHATKFDYLFSKYNKQ